MTSLTKASEAIITTGVIDSKQKIDVMTLDTPNLFVQIYISLDIYGVIMKIRGKLFNILIENFLGVYEKYVQYKGRKNILYVRILKALNGMPIYLILY